MSSEIKEEHKMFSLDALTQEEAKRYEKAHDDNIKNLKRKFLPYIVDEVYASTRKNLESGTYLSLYMNIPLFAEKIANKYFEIGIFNLKS